MTRLITQMLGSDAPGLSRASTILRRGGLVAFPTETVYGLGADARDGRAVAAIYEAKGRPRFNPLIVHVASLGQAEVIARIGDPAHALAAQFWPGPLTLVLPLREDAGLSELVTAGLGSVAIRVPAHPVAQALLSAFGGPVAAPSANPSGRVSPTTAAHVMDGLGGRIDAIVDGGSCPVGVESTILSLVGRRPVLLREGGVPIEALEAHLGTRPDMPVPQAPGDQTRPSSPGQLASHYAPRGAIRLNAAAARPGEVMLGFGQVAGDLTLSASGDLTEAAARLFWCLHRLDEMGAERIAVAPVPNTGLGAAINDRLSRAAARRD